MAKPKGSTPFNHVAGLVDFLIRWEKQEDESRCRPVELAVSDNGNINLRGAADCYNSLLLTRWHPSFESSIEPGVRDLVMSLIRTWDCVTYSSCEGHPPQGSVPRRPRHIGLIARSASEHARLECLLKRLVALTNSSCVDGGFRLRLIQKIVTSDENIEALALDLLFESAASDDAVHDTQIELLYLECLRQVEEACRLDDSSMSRARGDASVR